MQVIGFNFTKIKSEREQTIPRYSINTNIEFINLKKEKVDLLKDLNAVKIKFQYLLEYKSAEDKDKDKKVGDITFEGHIVFAVSKEEEKNLLKAWKKKQISPNIQVPLFNLILKKCSPKAVWFSDELGLPSPVPLPKITPKQQA